MELTVAQRDIAAAYYRGAPGALVSGLVWLIAGTVWANVGLRPGFTTLFFGGMLIMPLSLVVARALKAPSLAKGNPLTRLALEGTFFLFAGLLIAYCLLDPAPQLVFPVMAVTIGARYFTFRTLYGEPVYWALAAVIVATGAVGMIGRIAWPVNIGIVVGIIEIAFAILLIIRQSRNPS